MTTYQNYRDHRLDVTSFKLTNVLHMLFAVSFVIAVFIVPTIGAMVFLFF
jgi:hypothetical protein